jgi:hypothetical protein
MTIGFCEKSTRNPDGAWQAAQVTPAEIIPPLRCVEWSAPTGASSEEDDVLLAPHPAAKKTMLVRIRTWGRRGDRMTP